MAFLSLRTRWIGLATIVIVAGVVTAALKPMPQPTWYHNFADTRALLGVPNAGDVLSNLAFIVVGLAGLYFTLLNQMQSQQRLALLFLFGGLFLTGFGSGYYHLAPDNQRLVWDRLPMTIAMAGLMTVLLADRLRSTPWWVPPLLTVIGMGTVVQWSWSENRGAGDLRWYLLYEGLTFFVSVYLLLVFPKRGRVTSAMVIAFLANLAAKVFEFLDKPTYATGHVVSGHTLKHLAAGLGFVPLVVLASRSPERPELKRESSSDE